MTRQFAGIIRRFPFIIRIPYQLFRRIQPKYTIGVVGVIINTSGHVLLVEHVFHPEHPWGLPGGWLGNNEEPAIAVTRELNEELQLNATVKQLIHIEKRFKNHIDMAFLCEPSNNIGELSYELLDYKWVDPKQLPPLNTFHLKVIEIALNMIHRS